MIATVKYPYRDRETLEVHYAGETVELTEKRFAELAAGDFVVLADVQPIWRGAPDDAADGAPDEAGDAAPAEIEQPEEQPASDMTAAQLRSAIEAKGGFAPAKATKAQLKEILGTL